MNLDIEAERKLFEKWMVEDHKFIVDWSGNDPYTFGHTRDCWAVWQARAALAAPQQEPVVKISPKGKKLIFTMLRHFWPTEHTLLYISAPPAAPVLSDDTKRLDFLAQHEAWIAWCKDGESCRVFCRNDDDGEPEPFMGWSHADAWHDSARDAIDAALLAKGENK